MRPGFCTRTYVVDAPKLDFSIKIINSSTAVASSSSRRFRLKRNVMLDPHRLLVRSRIKKNVNASKPSEHPNRRWEFCCLRIDMLQLYM